MSLAKIVLHVRTVGDTDLSGLKPGMFILVSRQVTDWKPHD